MVPKSEEPPNIGEAPKAEVPDFTHVFMGSGVRSSGDDGPATSPVVVGFEFTENVLGMVVSFGVICTADPEEKLNSKFLKLIPAD